MGTNGINNVYGSFYNVGNNTVLPDVRKKPAKQDEKSFLSQPIASVFISDNEKEQKKSPLRWGLAAVYAAVSLAVLSVLFTRGGTGKFASKMNKWISKMDDKIYENARTNKTANFAQKALIGINKCFKSIFHGLKVATNITPTKDIFFNKLFTNDFSRALKLDKIPELCTKFSRNLTMRTNTRLARNAQGSADDLCEYISTLTKNASSKLSAHQLAETISIEGKTLTRQQWLEKAQKLSEEIRTLTNQTFNTSARNTRFASIDKKYETLDKQVASKIFGKDAFKTLKSGYATENITAPVRKVAVENLQNCTRKISNNIENVSSRINDSLNILRGSLAQKDTKSIDLARDLSKKLEVFRNCKGSAELTERTKVSSKMQEIIGNLRSTIAQNPAYKPELKGNLNAQLDLIENILQTDKKGATEELHTILKHLYKDGEAAQHISQIRTFTNAVNKATKFEEGVYMRQAELKVGAALTDLGGLALVAGTGVYATCSQKDKDKAIAKGLTVGIPLIGASGLCLLQTSMGLTGIVPLLTAIIGGKILNMCGAAISDRYLASANSKRQFMNEIASLKMSQNNVNSRN